MASKKKKLSKSDIDEFNKKFAETAKQGVKKTAKKTKKKGAAKKTAKKPTKKPAKKPAKKPTKSRSVAKKPTTKKPAKKSSKKTAKKPKLSKIKRGRRLTGTSRALKRLEELRQEMGLLYAEAEADRLQTEKKKALATATEVQLVKTIEFYKHLLKKGEIEKPKTQTPGFVEIDVTTVRKAAVVEVVIPVQDVMSERTITGVMNAVRKACNEVNQWHPNGIYASAHYYSSAVKGMSPDGKVWDSKNFIFFSAWSGVSQGSAEAVATRLEDQLYKLADDREINKTTILHEIVVRGVKEDTEEK